jgi:putative transcriptional regulator
VLNDPSGVPAAEVMPSWSGVLHTDICVGGPVQTDSAVAVARLDPAASLSPPAGLRPIAGPWAVVDLDSEPRDASGAIVDAQLFMGYAGWGAGQLDGELRTGSWWVLDSAAGDLALGRRRGREGAWWDVLRRQRNDLRLASTFPEDPSLN